MKIIMLAVMAIASLSTAVADTFIPETTVSEKLVAAAIERTGHSVEYDGRYRKIEFPGGDVPSNIGVCTDVVVRSYRAAGIDLQKLVHNDMLEHFDEYPDIWGLRRPDPNIDHRRVPNLRTYFERMRSALAVTSNAPDYIDGDLVTWMLPGNLPHIGIVIGRRTEDSARPLIVHNIGSGPEISDILFRYPITGHYRFRGPDR